MMRSRTVQRPQSLRRGEQQQQKRLDPAAGTGRSLSSAQTTPPPAALSMTTERAMSGRGRTMAKGSARDSFKLAIAFIVEGARNAEQPHAKPEEISHASLRKLARAAPVAPPLSSTVAAPCPLHHALPGHRCCVVKVQRAQIGEVRDRLKPRQLTHTLTLSSSAPLLHRGPSVPPRCCLRLLPSTSRESRIPSLPAALPRRS